MAIAKGSKSVLAWIEEAAYNVAPGGNWNQMPLNTEALDENINTIQGEDIRSDRRNPSLRGGNVATGGPLTHDFGASRTATWFRHLLAASSVVTASITPPTVTAIAVARGTHVLNAGGDTFICTMGGTVTAGDVTALDTVTNGEIVFSDTAFRFVWASGDEVALYSHTITAAIDLPAEGLAFEKAILGGDTAKHIQFTGCRFNSFDLTVPQEGIVKANWGILAASSANLNAAAGYGAPTIQAEKPFSGFNALVHLNEADFAGGIAQVGRGVHKEFSLNIANDIAEDVYTIGSRFRQDLPEGVRKASGRMSLYFVDGTEYDYFKNETEVPVGLSLVHEENFVLFKFPEAKLTGSGTPKISGSGPMMADFDWTAYFEDSAGDYDMEIVIHNTLATPIV